jgi:cyclophilin family peptidyl-prolyl cis-trans isomerase
MTKIISKLCGLGVALALQTDAPAQTITNQPQSIIVNNDSTATFTVGAGGATSYQWYFNGTNILTDGANSDGVFISGSTNSALTLDDVTTNEAGSYTVVLNGSVTSAPPAVLTITNGTIVRFILTGFPGGGTSNLDVRLFDHDKPATVENFIHYVSSGAYSNMFLDRCAPGFVLQGGDDGASNRTSTTPPLTGWDIVRYTASNQFYPPFPGQVDSEFNVGPLIHNRFGTIAMAHGSSPDSASSAFFFNLADNTSGINNLDTTTNDSGPFTVFGRILNNSNVMSFSNLLAYFNTLSDGYGAVEPVTFLDYGRTNTIPSINLLPVDYTGTNAPANSNLLFCDFTNLTAFPVYTRSPTVSITSPATNALFTYGGSVATGGTASDDVGLANVSCAMVPQATGGAYANGGVSLTNYALGTTNWSLDLLTIEDLYGLFQVPELLPGSYELIVQSQNGAGYLSTAATQFVTITGVTTNGNGTVSFAQGQGVPTNINAPIGYPFQSGSNFNLVATAAPNWEFINWTAGGQTETNSEVAFDINFGSTVTANFGPLAPLNLIIVGNGSVSPITNGEYVAAVGGTFQATAIPGSGESFYGWNDGTGVFTNSTETFTMTSNMTLVAEFISNGAPKVISFTYPPANAKLNTNSFLLKGRITPGAGSAQITCQIFSTNTGFELGPLTTSGRGAWSVAVSNLPPDDYEVEAVATYAGGTTTAVSEKFSVQYFKGVEGNYIGLFICDSGAPVTPTNSGSFTLAVTASGAYSGRLVFPAYKPIAIIGKFNVYGNIGGAYYTLPFPGNPVYLYGFNLDLTNGTDEFTGSVVASNSSWSSQIVCYRAVTKLSGLTTPATGKYILRLDPLSWTNTNGYASLSVSSGGVLSLSGALPDGAAFSQATRVSKEGVWPLYAIPAGYKTDGALMGWETNQAAGVSSGQLYWLKAANVGSYLTNKIDALVDSTGTNYYPPAKGNYSIVFQTATNNVLGSNNLSVADAGDQFKPESATDSDKLAISLSGNGVLTGHFMSANSAKPLQFKGAFFGREQGGSGFFLEDDGQTGYFLLEPSPGQ